MNGKDSTARSKDVLLVGVSRGGARYSNGDPQRTECCNVVIMRPIPAKYGTKMSLLRGEPAREKRKRVGLEGVRGGGEGAMGAEFTSPREERSAGTPEGSLDRPKQGASLTC